MDEGEIMGLISFQVGDNDNVSTLHVDREISSFSDSQIGRIASP